MSTPFEELEYLADFLPEEGESVIVSRNHGELVCENFQKERPLDEMASPEFYGHLVHANERLNSLVARPVWISTLAWFWVCVLIHKVFGLGWGRLVSGSWLCTGGHGCQLFSNSSPPGSLFQAGSTTHVEPTNVWQQFKQICSGRCDQAAP